VLLARQNPVANAYTINTNERYLMFLEVEGIAYKVCRPSTAKLADLTRYLVTNICSHSIANKTEYDSRNPVLHKSYPKIFHADLPGVPSGKTRA